MDRKQSRESGFVSSSSKIESDRIWCRSTFSSLKLIHLSTQKIMYRWLLIVPVLLWFTVQGYNLCYSYMEFSLYLSSYFRIYFRMMVRLYFRINWEEPSLVVNLSLPSFLSLSSSISEKLNLLFYRYSCSARWFFLSYFFDLVGEIPFSFLLCLRIVKSSFSAGTLFG